ncbi:hypothetical protein ASPZODRAFT_145761 [Penicilliopsis zonata CBS 506.65]|uniref:Mis6 domain protein n=1 Tax=Penicilliopsis zonata CBS 506.65 TaxID=1073090 RepID=A0A1L9S9G2_9EURO|nr:hypothetical protein ASPZODRAFT_145761 [Penicilliopsis zonata CBS 506.65]OJJ43822.1 hypothetical protein ASPZODRAFT_145761 [Penicilliopsis zonata CBS 506.65]
MSSDSSPEAPVRPTGLLDALAHLETVAHLPTKQRRIDVRYLAKVIASDAYEEGISPAALERLVNLITAQNELDQSTLTILIKNLYPQDKISTQVVTKVVCCLGPSKNKPSAATQAQLLRWLILTYDYLEDSTHLLKLYTVLFNFLDMISLRKPLCHLLSLLTRRKHVKPFRIQALMELHRNSGGDEKELLGLLQVFKNYYPEIIIGESGLSRRAGAFFKHPDPEWSSHVKSLQDRRLERTLATGGTSFQVVRRGIVKRSKVEMIVPDVQTSRVSQNHTSLEELRSISDFVEKLDQIEPPNQMVSVLGDNMAQKYLLLLQPEIANRRLNDWLNAFLVDRLEHTHDGDENEPEALTFVLSLAVEYARHTKELPASVSSFLTKFLPLWNGRDHRDQILGLLEYLPHESFEVIHRDFLRPVEVAILKTNPFAKTTLLDYYSTLIRQWGIKVRVQSSPSEESKPLSQLIAHAELLALSVLEIPPHAGNGMRPASLSVIEFYSSVSSLFSHAHLNGRIRITVPMAPTVYTLAFTPIASLTSILGSILTTYKTSFETSLTSEVLQVPSSSESLYPTELVGQFNGYVMDICNLVWRNRALNAEDPNALGCLVPASTVATLTRYIRDTNEASKERKREDAFHYNLTSVFSLSHHAALCNFSAACIVDIERTNGLTDSQPRLQKPVTQKALSALEKEGGIKLSWQEYRLRMLEWLDGVGSQGIGDLMRSTMKALRKE